MLGIVPNHLVRLYLDMDLVGNAFSLSHFRVEPFYLNHSSYEFYKVYTGDWAIIIYHNTVLTGLAKYNVANGFPQYPLTSSITNLARYHRNQRVFIGIFLYFNIVFSCKYILLNIRLHNIIL